LDEKIAALSFNFKEFYNKMKNCEIDRLIESENPIDFLIYTPIN
jgi:hypothetical protein